MKMKKRIKQAAALALALAVAIPAAYQADAAIAIETYRQCSIQFELEDTAFTDLTADAVTVSLYRVADVDSSGQYTELTGFEDLELGSISSQTTAQEWEEKAALAAETVETDGVQPAVTFSAGSGITGVETGMYLVAAQTTLTAEHIYRFTPYLLALPNNEYSQTGNDDWLYDVTTGLKPEQELRYGGVQINKTLDTYNATLDGASFVFSVEAVKDGEKVYSDVVSLVFDGPGTRSVEVSGIPAGAQVTVTEIYSGASYQLTGSDSEQAAVSADEFVPVEFTNTYNGENNGGSSILNHFSYEAPADESGSGSWDWSQYTDGTQVPATEQEDEG